VTIVWIAAQFTDEHRAALDWLNESTAEGINFFGLEIELWRIAGSPVAPKFNVISKPNDWYRTISTAARVAENLTETSQFQLEFWTGFRSFMQARKSFVRSQKPQPQNWTDFAIGRSTFHLSAVINIKEKFMQAGLVIKVRIPKPTSGCWKGRKKKSKR
jgi:hypothetical protein